ncbi:MAG TPA: superoxide dismutase family protein [Allosphingosinicella sp.]|nr:superoxide dismutase family protein [Allosphingosinicella sp.]
MRKAIAAMLLLESTGASAQAPRVLTGASADLVKADGAEIGSVSVRPRGNGIDVSVIVSQVTPGRYGIHIHAVGRCEGPAFESAGPHWNPTSRHHGRLNPNGPHLGDLPNIEVEANGRGTVRFTIAHTLNSLLNADGASIVLHAAADDERTDPSGNSGARIACGVLRGYGD